MRKRVAFIGQGIMGAPMSARLIQAGNRVTVYNRTRERTDAAVALGARAAETAREAAAEAEVVVLMVTGPQAIDALLEGPEGILAGLEAGVPLVQMSTVSPVYTDRLAARLAERGVPFVDAPVSGSKKPAEDGTLVILAAGDEALVQSLEPLLLRMGKKVVYCGAAGQGTRMKMTVNALLGIMMAGLCEALDFGARCGLTREAMEKTIAAGPLSCGLYAMKTGMLARRDYPPQFPFKHMAKDLRFLLETADEVGAAAPLARSLFPLYLQGLDRRLGDRDFAAIAEVLAEMGAEPAP